ncbi:branched-chain amino acid ABC transporter permease [Ramlibacter sp.]|uniref:branched-chain amino acid ABC transporter permease n=1 Tax=Ramlibacter sp. TaxID=1917967 RepID=UPI003D107C62
MALFLSAVISGIASGVLLALLGFGVVLLYKATGVANFAQGALGTLGAFIAYKTSTSLGIPIFPSILIALVAMLGLGAVFYWFILRPHDDSGRLNLVIRTLGLEMLIFAVVEHLWAAGQPFAFPKLFGTAIAFHLGPAAVSWATVAVIGIAIVMAGLAYAAFRFTDVGLMFIGMSEKAEIVQMLGIRTRRLTLLAWMITSSVAALVGVLLAPHALLSSDMMEPYLLLAFTAVVIGGLTSLPGVWLGGIVVGVVNNVVSLYGNGDLATFVIFALLLFVLSFRPQGLFGHPEIERL